MKNGDKFCALRVKCRQIAAPPSTDSNAQGIPAAGARNDEHVVIASASEGASFRFSLITLCVHPKPSLRDPLPQHSIMVFALDGKGSRQSARRFLERSLTHRTKWDSLITGETYIPMLEKRERQIAAPPSGNSGFHVVPAAGARNDQHIVITSASVGASFRFSLITLCVHPKPSLRDPLPQHSIMVFALDGKGSWQSAFQVIGN